MMTTYFSFAMADSMVPETCSLERSPLTVDEVREKLGDGNIVYALNPSHAPTCDAAIRRFGLPIVVPNTAPKVQLKEGDTLIVMSVRGLPRMEGRHEYTQEEIDRATFVFGAWTVTAELPPQISSSKEEKKQKEIDDLKSHLKMLGY